jgi:hypothetical protein
MHYPKYHKIGGKHFPNPLLFLSSLQFPIFYTKHTIVQAGKIVEKGKLDSDKVNIPGIFVHTLVKAIAK